MVKAKKNWGQHFLKELEIAEKVVNGLSSSVNFDKVLEIGPGKGVLTGKLFETFGDRFYAIEVDPEMNAYLLAHYPGLKKNLLNMDVLQLDMGKYFTGNLAIIGNFPYNISSQIIFKALENKDQVVQLVGMFQKEMAKRIVANPGTKDYGIISVLTQCYYDREYLFEVDETAFTPPPKVKSAVIRLTRNKVTHLDCDETLFKRIVKSSFNKRRKKMRNGLKEVAGKELLMHHIFDNRPEQLSLDDFVTITKMIAASDED